MSGPGWTSPTVDELLLAAVQKNNFQTDLKDRLPKHVYYVLKQYLAAKMGVKPSNVYIERPDLRHRIFMKETLP